jgi:hypothetical protein
MANALNVLMKSLFEPMNDVEGYFRIAEQVYQFNRREELNRLLKEKWTYVL